MTQDLASIPYAAFFEHVADLDEDAARAAMVARCERDRGLFNVVYFPERFDARFNALHHDFARRHAPPWHERKEPLLEADAAPRGAAKSTWSSFGELVHDAVYGRELYVVVVSTTRDLSNDLVKDLHQVFTEREAASELWADFAGPAGFRVSGTQTDFVVYVPGGDPRGVRFKAFSFGSTIRGTKHAGKRPTKILVDDGEHPERVRSPEQRAKTWEFLTKDILKAGKSYTRVRVVGTVLHMASMLADLLQAPNWKSTKWKAIQEWPERMDLWEECRKLWADLSDPARLDTARAFYDKHAEEMNRGAAVLWPEEQGLWKMMQEFWSDPAAFYSERQNEPRDPTKQIFDVDRFARCTFDGQLIREASGRLVDLRTCVVGIVLDPVPAKSQRGDFAAVVMMARDREGYRYVLRCVLRRCAPSEQRAIVWDMWKQAGATDKVRVGVEGNGFQRMFDEDFERDREERREAGEVWSLDPTMIVSTTNKEDGIAALEPACVNGWLQFDEALPRELLDMFRDFPGASHDDGPDAIRLCDHLISDRAFARATWS